MTVATAAQPRFQGLLQIIRFNWTFYAIAAVAIVAAGVLVARLHRLPLIRIDVLIGIGVAFYFTIASLAASFWIYDCSALRQWGWIGRELPQAPERWINLHCGLDESTPALRELFPHSTGRVFDLFDPAEMTEPSIHRARALARPAIAPEPARYDHLPADDQSCDAAFLLLSAHELRHHAARVKLFRELFRVIRPAGSIVLAEHLRDAANFLAFGPGFLHFHTRAAWRRAAREAGLTIDREMRITPFVAVFVIRRPS